MHRYTVDVGWTNTRPVIPEQHTSRVTVLADTGHDAELTALFMVMVRPAPAGLLGMAKCVMPTSSTVIDWEEDAP